MSFEKNNAALNVISLSHALLITTLTVQPKRTEREMEEIEPVVVTSLVIAFE